MLLPMPTVEVGSPAPPIELPDHSGGTWKLRDHAGHPVVLIFHRHLG